MKKKVLVYCATGYALKAAYSLDTDKYDVIGFCDSNPEVQDMYVRGVQVYSPNEIETLAPDYILISRACYYEDIKKYLVESHHVDAEIIVPFISDVKELHFEEERIVMLRKCIDIIKEREIKGAMAEVGVYQGAFSRLMNRFLPDRKLYLFDTFNGFDSNRDVVRSVDLDNFKNTSVQYVLGRMDYPEKCVVKKGYFPDTAKDVDDTFSLVSLDCDLYEPILAGLNYFYPRLTKGGYIFIHDFESYHYQGVKKAVYEFLETHPATIVPISDICGSVIIGK